MSRAPAFRFVTVDQLMADNAALTARCPHVHPSSHRLFRTFTDAHTYQCGGCRRAFTGERVVDLAREQTFVEMAFDLATTKLARDPHGLQSIACLAAIDDAFDAIEYMAGEFGVWL